MSRAIGAATLAPYPPLRSTYTAIASLGWSLGAQQMNHVVFGPRPPVGFDGSRFSGERQARDGQTVCGSAGLA